MSEFEYVKLFSNGKASYSPVGPLSIQCDLDVSYFPFDKHLCDIKFESMRYQTEQQQLVVVDNSLDLSSTRVRVASDQWLVTPIMAVNDTLTDVFDNSFSNVIFTIELTRRPEFFIVSLILPLVSISFVQGTVFILPLDSVEKLELSFASLLAFSFFSSMMTTELPHNSRRMPYLLIIINLYTVIISFVTIIEAGSIYFARCSNSNSRKLRYDRLAKWLNIAAVALFSMSVLSGTFLAFVILPSFQS